MRGPPRVERKVLREVLPDSNCMRSIKMAKEAELELSVLGTLV